MRRRAVVWSVISSGAVLAIGWQLGSQGQTGSESTSASAAGGSAAGASAPSSTPIVTPTPTPSPSASSGSSSSGSSSSGSSSSGSSSSPSATATPTPTPSAEAAAPAAASGTFTGTSVSTRYGSVQVQIVVANGSITDVVALKLTDDDNRSVSISNRAAPVLRSEVLSAQSASVQGVSGATYTSDAYLQSLQSAIDQAGL